MDSWSSPFSNNEEVSSFDIAQYAESKKCGILGSNIPIRVLPSEEGFAQKSRSLLRVPKLSDYIIEKDKILVWLLY